MRYIRALFFEYEEYCENEKDESDNVIPTQSLVFHYQQYDDGEDGERHSLLNHLQLPNRERSSELGTAAAIGRHHKTILGKCHEPTQTDDGEQSETLDFALEKDLTVPSERHKDVGTGEKQYGEYSSYNGWHNNSLMRFSDGEIIKKFDLLCALAQIGYLCGYEICTHHRLLVRYRTRIRPIACRAWAECRYRKQSRGG